MPLYNEPILPAYVDTNNITSVAEYYIHHPVPQRLQPAIIIASIAVAALGSYSTLLLLGRRTSNKGVRNVFLLLLAATTMSSVGIWGMHFIGMHMTLRPAEGINWYFAYSPAWTVFSLFVPTLALAAAFLFLDGAESDSGAFSMTRIILSGTAVGGLVGLMHFSAALSGNFKVSYAIPQLIGSVVLAMTAATVAMASFFSLRRQWQDNWTKRLLCSLILATGVCSMHYLAVSGTSYTVRPSSLFDVTKLMAGNRRNNVVTIAIGVMCFCILGISTFLAVSDVVMAREVRRNARKVVVASVAFDKSGRLLVKADGSLPMVVLETKLRMSEVMDALDRRHSTFQWLYTISWDWGIIAPFLRAITSRFAEQAQNNATSSDPHASHRMRGAAKRALSRRVSLDQTNDRSRGPQALGEFRDRVIDAASQLSIELDIPFHQVGILYDSVLPTGTRKATANAAAAAAAAAGAGPYGTTREFADDESSIAAPSIFGEGADEQEGVTLFLVRELPTAIGQGGVAADVASAEKYRQRGYRVTETRFLAGVLADRFAVAKPQMEQLLDSLKVYAKRGTKPVVQPSGCYVSLFGVRPSTSKEGGLDVLVYNFARHQIPAYRLPEVACITHDMRNFLRDLDQLSLDDAGKVCEREAQRNAERKKQLRIQSISSLEDTELLDEEQALEAMIRFQTALFIALDALHNSVRFYPKLGSTARISAEVLEVPSSLDDSAQPAEMILVQAVLPEERAMPPSYSSNSGLPSSIVPTDQPNSATPFVFTPYTLFSKSQMMLLRGRQADDFEHEVVLELRRRYPSSLLQENEEEKGSPQIDNRTQARVLRKASMISDHYASSSYDHLKEVGLEKDDSYNMDEPKRTTVLPAALRRWTSKLSNTQVHSNPRASRDLTEFPSSERRRISCASATSRSMAGADSSSLQHHSQQQLRSSVEIAESNLPILNHDDPRRRSPASPGDSSSSISGPVDMPSPFRGSQGVPPVPAATTTGQFSSLGIRRFTQDHDAAASYNSAALASQSRFVRAPEEAQIAEEDADVDAALANAVTSHLATPFEERTGAPLTINTFASNAAMAPNNSRPVTPTTATQLLPKTPPRRGSKAHPLSAHRPSTAPSSGYSRTHLPRPRTAVESPTSPVLSQRHAAMSTLQNEASVMARLRSDDWSSRQLRALERGNGSSNLLLGVDY